MSFAPLRFLHAARVLLDRPLTGTGAVPDDIRTHALTATRTAWEHLVAAALAKDVDFVLLSGDTFYTADRTVAAAAAFLRGCEKLAAQGIPVLAMPGRHDPASAWDDLGPLPENVQWFAADEQEPAEITRDSRTIALIQPLGAEPLRRPLRTGGAWGIGVIGVEQPGLEAIIPRRDSGLHYLATNLGGQRAANSGEPLLIHAPGGLQGISPRETGPCGASLVIVDAAGKPKIELLPVAPVRWERIAVTIGERANRNELLGTLRKKLAELETAPQLAARLVAWQITGSGALWDQLHQPAFQAELARELHRGGGKGPTAWSCGWTLTTVAKPRPAGEVSIASVEEFVKHLPDRRHLSPAFLEAVVRESELKDGPWEEKLVQIVSELDPLTILELAEQLGAIAWSASKEVA